MAKIGLKQLKNTCFEEEKKSTIQIESELHLATVRFVLFYGQSAQHCYYNYCFLVFHKFEMFIFKKCTLKHAVQKQKKKRIKQTNSQKTKHKQPDV